MPETAVQGPAGVSLTSNTLGPRKASQQSLGIFSPASCYVTQRNCGFAPGPHRALSVGMWLGCPGVPLSLLSAWADALLILSAEPRVGTCSSEPAGSAP